MIDEGKYLSPLVSCLECRATKSAKGIFSHFITAHTEDGKQRAKDNFAKGSKVASQNTKRKADVARKEKEDNYLENPEHCTECGITVPYRLRIQKICSKSCSASRGNKSREASGWEFSDEQRKSISDTLKQKERRQKKVCHLSICQHCSKFFEGYKRKVCSKECLSLQARDFAHKNQLGMNGQRSGKLEFRKDSFGNSVRLESSYESLTANLLDELHIQWIRPKYIKWIDSDNISHRYFPDFYLPDHDVYLDPKNKHLIEKDREKIHNVSLQNDVKILILPIESLEVNKLFELIMVPPTGSAPVSPVFQTGAFTRLA